MVPITMEGVLLALAGGVLIGLSASALLLANGRIAGVSGLAGWCPGPATTLSPTLLTFLVAMAAGLWAGERVHRTIGEAQAAAARADEADTDG